jgi:hypothetical protein
MLQQSQEVRVEVFLLRATTARNRAAALGKTFSCWEIRNDASFRGKFVKITDQRLTRKCSIKMGTMARVPVAGEIAKDFELLDSTRAPRRLSELISQGRLVLLFYRGNW